MRANSGSAATIAAMNVGSSGVQKCCAMQYVRVGAVALFLTAIVLGAAHPARADDPTPVPGPADAASTARQDAIRAALVKQCALRVAGDTDGYRDSLTPDFKRTGPVTQNEGRDDVVKREKGSVTDLGLKTESCDFFLYRTMPTPSGPFAEYLETDHMNLKGGKFDIIVRANADFVARPDGTLVQQSMIRHGFKFVKDGKIFHLEGTLDK
jgi:hypothetical protein